MAIITKAAGRWFRLPGAAVRATFAREHGLALLLYAALSVALSWPTVLHFSTSLTSNGIDARHNLWTFWHTQQALLGRQPLFDAPLLYYPRGISLLTHAPGPLTSLFALPLWPWGPEAAYNGALLVCLGLTGYCTYLLARGLELEHTVALFAGVMAQSSPMCVAGLHDHVTKVFLGALPLVLLALHRALDERRSAWWVVATALGLLVALLHDGWQFVKAVLTIGFFVLAALPAARRAGWFLVRRCVLLGLAGLVVVGPLLLAITGAASNPAIRSDVRQESYANSPDLIQFLLPPQLSSVFGSAAQDLGRIYAETESITHNSETAVSLSIAGLALCLLAWASGAPARRWVLLTGLCVLLALGPALRVLNQTYLAGRMPYAFLVELPGLTFMRMPGRFMQLGFITFAIAASFGLARLRQRFPRHRGAIVLAATALVLIEVWPRPAPQETLPTAPRFYQQIAGDGAQYGVFDLPLKSSPSFSYNWKTIWSSSYYQIFQMTHGKGIASGYISRVYSTHPLFADFMTDYVTALKINGRLAAYVNFLRDLAHYNYRYVVLHKGLYGGLEAVDAGEQKAREVLAGVFGSQVPLVDDAQVTVYQVQPISETVDLRWGRNWRPAEEQWRWAASPATLTVDAPARQAALLQVTPAVIHDPAAPDQLGSGGTLIVQVGDRPPVAVSLAVDQPASVPIELLPGSQTITLTLEAGNFQPAGEEAISFAVRSIDLRTADHVASPSDIHINGQPVEGGETQALALLSDGWEDIDPNYAARWASSPAELLVYSPVSQEAQLQLLFQTVYDGASGLSQDGTLAIRVNDGAAGESAIQAGQPTKADVPLRAGWNHVELVLAAGNFHPNEIFPGNGDQRLLSFQLKQIDIIMPNQGGVR